MVHNKKCTMTFWKVLDFILFCSFISSSLHWIIFISNDLFSCNGVYYIVLKLSTCDVIFKWWKSFSWVLKLINWQRALLRLGLNWASGSDSHIYYSIYCNWKASIFLLLFNKVQLKKSSFSAVKLTFDIERNWLVLDHFHGIPSGLSLKVSWKVSTNKCFGSENENVSK